MRRARSKDEISRKAGRCPERPLSLQVFREPWHLRFPRLHLPWSAFLTCRTSLFHVCYRLPFLPQWHGALDLATRDGVLGLFREPFAVRYQS